MSETGTYSLDPPSSSPYPNHWLSGADFILDQPATIPALWGSGSQVLWSQGEALLLVGPPGVGKSTVAQQLVLRRIGVLEGPLFEFPIVRDSRSLLYLALDRPLQIARSFYRMVTPNDRAKLGKMVVWPKPLPFDIVKNPAELASFSSRAGAGTVVIDSLKDLSTGLDKPEVGNSIAHAFQHLVAANIEVVALHHMRKSSREASKANNLDEIYGSAFLTATAGSVVALERSTGDARVRLVHQKQPAETVGPLDLKHNHHSGTTELLTTVDVLQFVQTSSSGVTVRQVASALAGTSNPEPKHIEQARRRLKIFVNSGDIFVSNGPFKQGEPEIYVDSATRGNHGGGS